MGFRTVIVENRSKLEYRLGYLVVRGEEERQVHISEINTLILESTAISLTCALLCELVKQNVKVIFCDEKHMPQSELLPYYGSYNNVKRIRRQFEWDESTKAIVWMMIVREKIKNQSALLRKNKLTAEAELLDGYIDELELNDASNREGHAAKVYFNKIFGDGFARGQDNYINAALNYGYAVLLAAFNREIVSSGCLTQLGIWHRNEFNDFNLGCDFMEPFRCFADKIALTVDQNDFKQKMQCLLKTECEVDGQKTTVDNAIKIYTRSLIDVLNGDRGIDSIKFVRSDEL